MVVILLGPPGVGKGTQARYLADLPGWIHLSTGDLLRSARREGTELGRKAQGFMDAGQLVPDHLILDLVRETVAAVTPADNLLFDGFPRTLAQAEALDPALAEMERAVDRVLVLEAPDAVLLKRLSGRRTCGKCGRIYNVYFDPPRSEGRCDDCGGELQQRKDDDEATVARRLEVYREQTEPLIRYYEENGTWVEKIEGDRSPEQVRAAVADGVAE